MFDRSVIVARKLDSVAKCPYCESESIVVEGSVFGIEPRITLDMYCNHCYKTNYITFDLTYRYSEINVD